MSKTIKSPVTLTCVCPFCGKSFEIVVDSTDYLLWVESKCSAQEAFPYLTADQRELVISGTCPECWDKEFNAEWR